MMSSIPATPASPVCVSAATAASASTPTGVNWLERSREDLASTEQVCWQPRSSPERKEARERLAADRARVLRWTAAAPATRPADVPFHIRADWRMELRTALHDLDALSGKARRKTLWEISHLQHDLGLGEKHVWFQLDAAEGRDVLALRPTCCEECGDDDAEWFWVVERWICENCLEDDEDDEDDEE